jgi:DNA-binding winged helix-turn-helix (wHTH) protein
MHLLVGCQTRRVVIRFGQCVIDLDRMEIELGGVPQPVQPQVFEVIAYLVAHRDRVVSKEELLDNVWGDRFVGESALTSRIKSARQALGDSGAAQLVIRTVHGRGYRFVAVVDQPDRPQLRPAAARDLPAAPPRAAGGWPLVGCFEVLERLVALPVDPACHGAAVCGPPGAGATRVAREAYREWVRLGHLAAYLAPAPAMATIPLAALARLVPDEAFDLDAASGGEGVAQATLFRRATRAISELADGTRLIVVVDGADRLDELSRAVLTALMEAGVVFGAFTMRAAQTFGPNMVRIDLPALSDAEIDAALFRALGGPIERALRDSLQQASRGRPGLLRDVVEASRGAGAIVEEAGVWRLCGPLVSSRSVEWPVSGLSDAAHQAAELIALAGALGVDHAEHIAGAAAVAELDRVGLLAVGGSPTERTVMFADPLQAGAAVAAIGPIRERAAKSALVTELLASGRPADLASALQWAAEIGHDTAAVDALGAAQRAMTDGDDVAAERLVRHLARIQPELGPYLDILEGELALRGHQYERAERRLAAIDRTQLDGVSAAWVVRRLGFLRMQVAGEYRASQTWLAEQERQADGSAAQLIAGQRAVHAVLLGNADEALEIVTRLGPTARGWRRVELEIAHAGALLLLGELAAAEQMVAHCDALLAAGEVAAGDAAVPAEATTALRIEVLVASGRLDLALEVARPILGRRGSTNWTAVEAAAVELAAGRPRAARELIRPSVELSQVLGEHNLAQALAFQGMVFAALGQYDAARHVVDDLADRFERLEGGVRWTVVRALCRLTHDLGEPPTYVERALAEADLAEAAGARFPAAQLLMTAAVCHPDPRRASGVGERLSGLAGGFIGPLWPIHLAHVTAIADGRPLDAIADQYRRLGYIAWAALAAGDRPTPVGPASVR